MCDTGEKSSGIISTVELYRERPGEIRGALAIWWIMKEFAKKFYKSKAWQNTRDAYAASVGGLCEDCLERGLYKAGEIVHHKRALTPENISDPLVTLAWDNLKLLCRDCHAKEHGSVKRYKVDEFGKVTIC